MCWAQAADLERYRTGGGATHCQAILDDQEKLVLQDQAQ